MSEELTYEELWRNAQQACIRAELENKRLREVLKTIRDELNNYDNDMWVVHNNIVEAVERELGSEER